jgi:23S rRNA (uracil1939-C5)-methyltransferase
MRGEPRYAAAVGSIELRPDRFAAGGEAIARDADGRVVFARGALPGEVVVVEITHEKRDWARGHVVDVVEPSPDRVVPPCDSRRAGCGGCGWQHLTHDAQRRAKVVIVDDALRRIGGIAGALVELGPSVEPTGYRTTTRLAAAADGRAGFRAEHSHDVIAAPACLVAHPTLRSIVGAIRLDPGVEPTVRLSVATGEVGARWDRKQGDVRGLPSGVLTGGGAVMHEEVAGRRLQVSLGSFFQSGPQAADLLVRAVGRAAPELADAAVVVDAYAGIGMFAACATQPDAHVIAIETSRAAVNDAHENLNGRRGEIVRGEVGGWHPPGDLLIDVVVADPARSGLGQPGTAALARAEAPVLVLVSCDPASLGRDAKLLTRAGYAHERSEVLDTFPHTTHIEVVSRFVTA